MMVQSRTFELISECHSVYSWLSRSHCDTLNDSDSKYTHKEDSEVHREATFRGYSTFISFMYE